MEAQEHPFFEEEKQHLDATFEYIEGELAKAFQVTKGEHLWTSPGAIPVLLRPQQERIQKLKECLREEPYFGRVDWKSGGVGGTAGPEVFYIGKHEIFKQKVYSWADNLVADLYYELSTDREKGTLLLKRLFGISRKQLVTISDDYVDPSLIDRLSPARFTDTLLAQLLGESRGGRLRDIVATIQKQQFSIIRSPKDQVLLVQGAAGSGKTEIALHRVAYLLYNHKNELSAPAILILGPNNLFLGYTANVLPSLGERHVSQWTFDEWIKQRLDKDKQVNHESQEASLEIFLDPSRLMAEKAMYFRNAQNKGSLKMASLLERYVNILHEEVILDKGPLVYTRYLPSRGAQIRVERSVELIRQLLGETQKLPFNQRKDALESRLVSDIRREVEGKSGITAVSQEPEKRDTEDIQEQVHDYFAYWHNLNTLDAYRKLLRTPTLLYRAGEGLFTLWDLELMAQDAPTRLTPFRFSDLAALLYLKILLDGTDNVSYSHIVVDEAQDTTPLHFKVLKHFGHLDSMTILGDLAQSIYLHHGICQWDVLSPVFSVPIQQEIIRTSYRSTQEIIKYANAMLKRTGTDESLLAVPIERQGNDPIPHPFTTMQELTSELAQIVRKEQADGWKSIALVCKTVSGCNTLAEGLKNSGLDFQVIDDRNAKYEGGTVIMPSYLTKGLEFDCVILVDADATSYKANELDVHLLYVSLTRSAHVLHICWVGAITPLLDASLDTVQVEPFMSEWLSPRLVMIEEYAQSNGMDPDWCVERLAGAGKLDLLVDGRMDEAVLGVLLQSRDATRERSVDASELGQLEPDVEDQLRRQITDWDTSGELGVQSSLALIQSCYGLLRHQIRTLGLNIAEDEDLTLADHAVLMVKLLKVLRGSDLTLPVGRWTTRRRVLDCLDKQRREIGQEILDRLLEHGIIEENLTETRYPQTRVQQRWVQGLAELSLGYVPDEWDTDLVESLPHLPSPIRWENGQEVTRE